MGMANLTTCGLSQAGDGGIGPRRILIVSDAWAPQVNGVVRTYEAIAAALSARGCTVKVIGPADFRSMAFPSYPEIPLALRPYRRLADMIDRFAPEAIHVGVEGPLGWAARHWCLRHGRAFSTAFHTNFPSYVALRAPGPLRRPAAAAARVALRRFHASARLTYVATASLEMQLRAWGVGRRFVRLTRGVDVTRFHPGPPRVSRDRPVLLYVGRVAPEKNIDAFLRIRCAADKVVVGDGPALPALRQAYPEVTFRGTLTGAALAEAYRAADAFVFPSRTDTFGMVLIEAMASGLPIAAHDVPGPRDIVTDPSLGALDADLGRAVARALAAPGDRAARHAHARETYSWDRVAEVFHRHCAELSA
jgi:glycosyltransferase involved in cell wall biosynthesis